jgi:predicted DNA binding protein
MWFTRFRLKHKDCLYAPLLKKYALRVFFYPLNNYEQDGFVYTAALQKVSGKNIAKYVAELSKKTLKCERYKNVITTLTKNKIIDTYAAIYDRRLMYPAPAYLDDEGFEIWHISCWDRKPLQHLIKTMQEAETTISFTLLALEQRVSRKMYVLQALPELTDKQEEAIELAYKEGYYDYPRRIELCGLAHLQGVRTSTFQEHLRKAEKKLMPYLLE